jgi:DNA-binding response OmpR family regulator
MCRNRLPSFDYGDSGKRKWNMPARIVVLDAEPVVRGVVADILSRGGYSVEPTDTVQAALKIVHIAPPDLVLTNVYLPGVTGHEAMRLIKEACPHMPVLMMSGLPDAEVIRQWAGQDGFDTFPKPFTAEELLAKVRAMLRD